MSREQQNFKVIQLKLSNKSTNHHELFVREHSARNYDETKPIGRTIFVINIPPYIEENNLKNALSKVAKVVSVLFQNNENKIGRFKTGHVVFENKKELTKVLELDVLSINEQSFDTGLTKWSRRYNSTIYNQADLDQNIKTFMAQFEKSEEKEKQKKDEVDEDGWTVVLKKGRNPGVSRKESVRNKLSNKYKKASKKKQLKNFYTFQIKEEKMKNIVALRKSFEDSKKKVEALKKLRVFKPF